MPFYPCRNGGGNKVKLVTVDVTSKDFPDLFTYIDNRNLTVIYISTSYPTRIFNYNL